MDKHSRGRKGTEEEAKESIRSTTESVRWTPINNDARDFTEKDEFLYGGRERGEKGGD